MKLRNKGRGKFVGLSSFIAVFALLATAVFCPFDGNNANAANSSQRLRIDFVVREALASGRLTIDFFLTRSGGIDYESIAKQLGIDFYIREKIYLGVNGLGNVNGGTDIAPTVDGTTVSGKTDFKVGTNNAGGLVVKVSSGKDSEGNPNSVNMTNSNGYAGLAPVESATLLGAMPAGHWGYNLTETASITNLDALEYKGLTVSDAADTKVLSNGDHNLSLAFGAKVDTTAGAGTYTGNARVEVATNPVGRAIRDDDLRTIERVINEYMDENPEYAAEVRAEQEKRRAEYEAQMNGEVASEDNTEEI